MIPTPWKLATIGAGLLNLVIAGFLVASHIENKAISKQRDTLHLAITDPNTGYIARLTQAKTSVAILKAQVERQNAVIRQQSAESAARLAETKRRLALAQAETRRMEGRLQIFLSKKIEGDNLEERVRNVDERAMKEFLNE